MSSPGASPKPTTPPAVENSAEKQSSSETRRKDKADDETDAANDAEDRKEVAASKSEDIRVETHNGARELASPEETSETPPLPSETIPPLPTESIPPLPSEAPPDDGWEPRWEETAQNWYFYNRFTNKSQWDNPRVPAAVSNGDSETLQLSGPPGVSSAYATASAIEQPPELPRRPAGGYDPAIHGDYDPTAWYAQPDPQTDPQQQIPSSIDPSATTGISDPASQYAATGAFNRFTGRWQDTSIHNPDNYSDENKSRRQMNAFFDVDAAANSHDGRSLKAERSGKRVSKSELKQFKEKRKAKKEEKRRAWLRD